MKSFTLWSSFLVCLSLALFSCNNRNNEVLSTELRVNIQKIATNGDTALKGGVVVELYRNQADMQMRRLPVASATTNSSGQAVFKNLKTVEYYVYAYVDEGDRRYDNSLGEIRLLDDLVEGSITVVTVYISNARPVRPSQMTLQYVEVIKFDTVNLYKSIGKHCSDSLRFFLVMYTPGSYNGTTVDSTVSYDNSGSAFSYCNFCYESGLAPSLPVFNSYFLNQNTFNLTAYSGFLIKVQTKQAKPPYAIKMLTDKDISLESINFDDYKINNTKGNPAYPTRLRLVQYPAPSAIVNDRYIDAIVTWN